MSFTHGPPSFRTLPPIIRALILANALGYIAMIFASGSILNFLALVPARVTRDLWLWQLVTYSFFHGSFFHVLFNMFALWMFGREIEPRMGSFAFLRYYLLTTVGASLTQVAIMPTSSFPTLGASGAVYGILAAFAVLFPEAIVYLYFLIPLKAKQLVLLFAALEFLAGATSAGSLRANFAHLGGLFTGLLYFKLPDLLTNVRTRRPSFIFFRRKTSPVLRDRTQATVSDRNELAQQVDKILEKVLRQGVQSLTREEQEIMRKYSEKKI